jgi:hypothetical protein
MRDDVYVEYHRPRDAGCCQVDHLIALEFGGSNEMRNLRPQPNDPKPGADAEDLLGNESPQAGLFGQDVARGRPAVHRFELGPMLGEYVMPQYGVASRSPAS